MRNNPFNNPGSPILNLYEKSRSKSQSNRVPLRSRSKSFRQFQVKAITHALEKHHIIQKEENGEKQRQMRRERQLSKYYGTQAFKRNAHPSELQTKRKPEALSNKLNSNRNSERISTLINIKPQTANCINSQRHMSYQSNYFINNREENRSDNALSSSNSLSQPSSLRSSDRKISFFSEMSNNSYQQAIQYKKSRFVNKKKQRIDRVKEEYYNQDYLHTRRDSRTYNYNQYA